MALQILVANESSATRIASMNTNDAIIQNGIWVRRLDITIPLTVGGSAAVEGEAGTRAQQQTRATANRTAIQDRIDYLHTTYPGIGGVIFVPAGTYLFDCVAVAGTSSTGVEAGRTVYRAFTLPNGTPITFQGAGSESSVLKYRPSVVSTSCPTANGGTRPSIYADDTVWGGAADNYQTIFGAVQWGGYGEVNGTSSAMLDHDASGFALYDLCIDQNTANNSVMFGALAKTSGGASKWETAPGITTPVPYNITKNPTYRDNRRSIVYLTRANKVTIQRCIFRDVGSCNAIALWSSGIDDERSAGQSTPIHRVQDCVINECVFDPVGLPFDNRDPSNLLWYNAPYDSSTIYIQGKGFTVANNALYGREMGGFGTRTALELHATYANIQNNYIRNFFLGAYLTGSYPGYDRRSGQNPYGRGTYTNFPIRSQTMYNNFFEGVLTGIRVRPLTYGTEELPGAYMKSNQIHENTILIDRDGWDKYDVVQRLINATPPIGAYTEPGGIILDSYVSRYAFGASDWYPGLIDGLSIRGNFIEFQDTETLDLPHSEFDDLEVALPSDDYSDRAGYNVLQNAGFGISMSRKPPMSGYAPLVTTLALTATQGATSISLTSVGGTAITSTIGRRLQPSDWLAFQNGVYVQVASNYVPGSTTVGLASALPTGTYTAGNAVAIAWRLVSSWTDPIPFANVTGIVAGDKVGLSYGTGVTTSTGKPTGAVHGAEMTVASVDATNKALTFTGAPAGSPGTAYLFHRNGFMLIKPDYQMHTKVSISGNQVLGALANAVIFDMSTTGADVSYQNISISGVSSDAVSTAEKAAILIGGRQVNLVMEQNRVQDDQTTLTTSAALYLEPASSQNCVINGLHVGSIGYALPTLIVAGANAGGFKIDVVTRQASYVAPTVALAYNSRIVDIAAAKTWQQTAQPSGTSWATYLPGVTATTTQEGSVTKAATQTDSVASDVPTLVSDYNALLGKLRTAGILST